MIGSGLRRVRCTALVKNPTSRAQQFCDAHQKCRSINAKYKALEKNIVNFIANNTLAGDEARVRGNNNLFEAKDFWFFTPVMLRSLQRNVRTAASLRRQYSKICIAGQPIDSGHAMAIERTSNITKHFRESRSAPTAKVSMQDLNKLQKLRLLKSVIRKAKAGVATPRCRTLADYQAVRELYPRASREVAQEDVSPLPEIDYSAWDENRTDGWPGEQR
jgi:hypothetical protein